MHIVPRILFSIAIIVSLSACGGDDDHDNSGVVAALEEQNDLLREANEIEQTQTSVTLVGRIVDLSTESPVEASVRVKVGSTWTDPVTTTDGDFEAPGVSPLSDYVLEVSSPTDAFLTRVFLGRSYPSDGVAVEDLGDLGVSSGVTRSYSLLNSSTDEPAEGFELKAYSHVIDQFMSDHEFSEFEEYAHVAVYNADSGTYDIVLPESIPVSVRGDLDIDSDGVNDYLPTNSQFRLAGSVYIKPQYVTSVNLIYLDPTRSNDPVSFSIAVFDSQLDVVPDLKLSVINELDGEVLASYDSDTERYMLTAKVGSELEVSVPPFAVGGVSYEGSTIQVYRRSRSFDVDYVNSDTPSVSLSVDEDVLNLGFEPGRASLKRVSILSQTQEIGNDGVYSILFSDPVHVDTGTIMLRRHDDVNVVRGDDSSSDLVPEGFTLVDQVISEVPVTYTLIDDDTRITIEPIGGLEEGVRYEYVLQGLSAREPNMTLEFFRLDPVFTTQVTGVFDISSVVADNRNYTTAGSLITQANSAGESSMASNCCFSNGVNLYFPSEVRNLNRLVMTLRLVNRDGVLSVEDREQEIIRQGSSLSSLDYALEVAVNEDVTADSSVILGSTLDEGFWLERDIFFSRIQDHTDANPNILSFEYELERRSGAVETGTIELEVQ